MNKLRDGDFIDTDAFNWCKCQEEKKEKKKKAITYDVNVTLKGGIVSIVVAACSIMLSVTGFLMLLTLIVGQFGI